MTILTNLYFIKFNIETGVNICENVKTKSLQRYAVNSL